MRRYVVTIVLAVGALGCFCAPMEGCGALILCADECEAEGKCAMRTEFAGDSPYRCYASSDDDCADSRACENGGRCHFAPTVEPDACVALQASDCLQSTKCKEKGHCDLREGSCVISFAGCMRSDGCRERGECHLKTRPVSSRGNAGQQVKTTCEALDVPDERWCSTACMQAGACTRRGNECIATSDEDCRGSQACTGGGRCSVGEDNTCVAASDEDCSGSTVCEQRNHCTALERGDYCVESSEPCAGSQRCAERGWCSLYKGICRADSDEDCQASTYCETDGECVERDHLCRPATAEHCASSTACDVEGKCALVELACQPRTQAHCRDSLGCEIAGLCQLNEAPILYASRCVVGSSKDCEQSWECEHLGRCVARPDPTCRRREHCPWVCAAPDEDVRLSCVHTRFCKEEGRCVRKHVPDPDRAYDNIRPRSDECVRKNEVEPASDP